MKEYKREYPLFSLCGLNCGLCPRYHTEGESKCPGCGGEDFYLKHPTCSVITCSKKHGNAEFCFQCSSFPCERYKKRNHEDSFISYRNVNSDIEKAKEDLALYIKELTEKVNILEFLLSNLNDGRRKNYYCIAVNLLGLEELRVIMKEVIENVMKQEIPIKNKIEQAMLLINAKADECGLKLELRKQ